MVCLARTNCSVAAASMLALAACLAVEDDPHDASSDGSGQVEQRDAGRSGDASGHRDASSGDDSSSGRDASSGPDASGSADASSAPDASSAADDSDSAAPDASVANPCVGKAWPTADPTVAGSFEVAADKKVGPLAGFTPDPIYGDEQQRFNVYRPKNLATSGYCHPILVWANGHTDNPEQNPPKCVVNAATGKWCGTYPPLINQLASHGFVVVSSLSTTTSKGDPLPTIVGLNWLLEQAENPTSVYYHRLDTAHIGALGHSEGGASTCKAASDARISAVATVSGTRALSGLHGPALFICGGKEGASVCDAAEKMLASVKDHPAMFINNLAADHGSWLGQGTKGPTISGLTAWFRAHLMGDAENRKRFYGPSCTFCTDSRAKVGRNTLMTQ